MRILRTLMLALSIVSLPACGGGGSAPATREAGATQTPVEADPLAAMAYALVDAMAAGDYETATADFDETMQKVLPPEKLKATWESLVARTGPFRGRAGFRKEKVGSLDLVFVRCNFEAVSLDVKVVLSPAGKVTGIWFVPPSGPRTFEPPPYARPDTYREREATVGEGEWVLPGTLTIPVGEGPFPAVVLVHGSGPNDRDETIGPNKPFRDLAWGLASRGIAVLRYEKRTRQYTAKLLSGDLRMTVKEEVIDDVLAALEVLRGVEEVDGEKLIVLGHSLGGMLIPRIGKEAPGLAGLVILAGTTRPLDEVILDQVDYITGLDGTVTEAEQEKIDEIREKVEAVRNLDPADPRGKPEGLLGVPPEYWLDLRGYHPPEMAKGVRIPMLILQGERDYQVTMADLEGWKKALSDRKDVKIKTYPGLNHLFIHGEGKPRPEEYLNAGHVAEEVIAHIADWVGSR